MENIITKIVFICRPTYLNPDKGVTYVENANTTRNLTASEVVSDRSL